MPLTPATRLGPYEIVAPLGAGGMGEVYRARDTRLGREVALKILPAEVAADPARRQRFEWEARAVAALNHPNIVAIFDVGHDETFSSYMVTELVEGESLRGVHVSLRKTLDLGVQIAAGLAAAHDAGVVHRDLKPENILLTRDGRVKILDFGLAKVTTTHDAAAGTTETMTVQTEPGMVMGTVGYMSPEQVRGLEVDHRTDIFSFGVILYELICGRRAFAGETSVDIMQAILRQEPAELSEMVAPGVRQIVARCLEKDPLNRFQSARDLGFALTQCSIASGGTPSLPRRWRFPVWAWAMATTAVAALAMIALFFERAPIMESWTGVLLGGPEIAMCPRISPDGHMLAFITMVDGNTQVGVMRPESGNWTVLTHEHDGGFINAISWSPDGTRIYYDRNAEVPLGIFSVPVLGGEEQPVLEDAQQPEALADGALLVVKLTASRRNRVFHFSPDTGHLQELPVEPRSRGSVYSTWNIRAFPNGKQALITGVALGEGEKAGNQLYILDLATNQLHPVAIPFRSASMIEAVAITHDGRNLVIAGGFSGNVSQVAMAPVKGGAARSLLTLTLEIHSIDAGPDGSIYFDQNDHTLTALRLPAAGGHAQKLDTFPSAQPNSATLLEDGRVVIGDRFAGRQKLMALEAGKDPTPLINTTEETADPVTVAGPREVAFLIGPEPRHTIGMATVANGRIVRRIPLNLGAIDSLAASPNGDTLFCAAGGSIWKVPTNGGAPVKLRAGDSVAMEPGGEKLLVQVNDPPRMRLFEIPLQGGLEREIPMNGPLYLSNDPISSSEIGRNGRMAVPLVSRDSWFYRPGIIDLKTGETSLIATDHAGDYHWLGWSPDGSLIAAAFDLRSTMWKFTRER